MVIGIDASRAFVSDKTGTEYYSYHLITHILQLPESKRHTFVLYTRPNAILPGELVGYTNVIVKEIKMKYLWTQVGLAWETWQNPKIDVLWVPAHTLPILRNPRIKTVVTIHGLEYQWLPEYKNWLQRWYLPLSTFYAAKYADKLIAVSKFTQKELIKATQIDKNKIKVVYEGVALEQKNQNIEYREKLYSMFNIRHSRYILFVGSVQPRKNLVALIEAFSKTDLEKLVIAGGIGWMAQEVLQAPAKFNVQERVVFTGRVSERELQELYLGAAIYVQPSITEGFGLPVLEAMSYGVPVISSDGGALPEILGDNGIVVKLGTSFVSQLGRAMKELVTNKKLQKNLITKGYKRVRELGWDRAAMETFKVLVGEGYNIY